MAITVWEKMLTSVYEISLTNVGEFWFSILGPYMEVGNTSLEGQGRFNELKDIGKLKRRGEGG